MRKDVMIKWVAALRSGKYIQGRKRLKQVSDTSVIEHCCLGVLCEVLGMKSRPNLGREYTTHTHSAEEVVYIFHPLQ